MNDKEFQRALDSLHKANKEYKRLLELCESEYKARFGFYPSEVDDDSWIESFHITAMKMKVADIGKYI